MTDPKIEVLPVDKGATPDPNNVNRHTQRGRGLHENSMRKRGAGRSIFSAGKGVEVPVTIGGNQTLEIAASLGMDVINVHTTGNQIVNVVRDDIEPGSPEFYALAIEDNEVAKQSYNPDIDILAAVMADPAMQALKAEDKMLADIVEGMGMPKETKDAEPQIDRAAELQEKWQTETGQLWQLGKHRLLIGDCTVRENVERLMGGEFCELVVTDPPYGVSYADKNEFLNTISPANRIQTPIENDHLSKEQTQEMWRGAFHGVYEVMKPGAVIYCFMPQGGDQMMMMMMMMSEKIEPRHEIIWLKNNHVLGRVDYAYKHEPILYAWKEGGHKFYGDFQTSVIECDKPQSSKLHPTMKPVELIEKLIANSSLKDGLLFEPFAGSGTTIIAAENLSRRCYAMEISPNYGAVILERFATAFPALEIKRIE